MEKTIEERAREMSLKYARQYHHNTCTEISEPFVFSDEEIRLACIDMATEQKAIDIDKACEWLKEMARYYGQAEGTDAFYCYDSDLLVKHFRKAMEKHTTKDNVVSKYGKPEDNMVSSNYDFLRGAEAERENQEAVRKFMKQAIIDKATEWWDKELREVNYGTYAETLIAFRKAME